MVLSGPKWEGFGLGGQFPLTVRGSGQGGLSASPFKKESFAINGFQST